MSKSTQKIRGNLNTIIKRMSKNVEKYVNALKKISDGSENCGLRKRWKFYSQWVETACEANFWNISIRAQKQLAVLRLFSSAAK